MCSGGINMEQLLEGKRVFKQELKEVKYFFLPEKHIEKYHYLSNCILIKKGDLLFPSRWVKYTDEVLLPLGSFVPNDYEYLFFTGWYIKHWNAALKLFIDIEIDDEFTNLLILDELPAATESSLRELLVGEKDTVPSLVEAYKYPGEDRFIILNEELTNSDIVEECTSNFAKKKIVTTYNNHGDSLYKTVPKGKEQRYITYSNQVEWYHCQLDETKNFFVLKEIYDIEDMLPFTKFQPVK